jgi:hypothetical protein
MLDDVPQQSGPRVPFDVYDFFGYLFPGSFFTGVVICLHEVAGISHIRDFVGKITNPNLNWAFGLLVIFASLVVVYVVGYVLGTISSIAIDRWFVRDALGYPFHKLLDIHRSELERRSFARPLVTYLLLAANTALVLSIMGIVCDSLSAWGEFFILVSGLLIALRLVTKPLSRPVNSAQVKWSYFDKFVRGILLIWHVPADLLLYIVESWLELLGVSEFSEPFREEYRRHFWNAFGLDADDSKTDNYWLPSLYASTLLPGERLVIAHFRNLYAFARNMCTACYLGSVTVVVIARFKSIPHESETMMVVIAFTLMALAIAMFARYYVLYASYYSKYISRAFVVGMQLRESSARSRDSGTESCPVVEEQ